MAQKKKFMVWEGKIISWKIIFSIVFEKLIPGWAMHSICVYTNSAFFSRWSLRLEKVQERAVCGGKS